MAKRERVSQGEWEEIRQGSPCLRELESLHKAMLDVPAHLRAIGCLPGSERDRFWQVWDLLEASGDAVTLSWKGDIALAGLGVFEALLARSWAVRYHDPKEMIHLARVACALSECLDPDDYGEQQVADFQARAWGELANAYRVSDLLWESKQAFGKAFSLLDKGSGDLFLRVRLFDLESSLLGASREFDIALDKLSVLGEMYGQLGESHLAGRALIVKALYTFYNDDSAAALDINREGLDLLELSRDPGLYMVAIHNHLLFLVDLGHFEQAKRALFENRRHFIYEHRLIALRLRWVEARIEYGLGNLMSAEIAFCEVREGFQQVGLGFATALASLELATVLMRQQRVDEGEAEAIAAQKVFRSLEIYREFLGALIFLEEAFRLRVATVGLLETTVAHIRRKEIELLRKLD